MSEELENEVKAHKFTRENLQRALDTAREAYEKDRAACVETYNNKISSLREQLDEKHAANEALRALNVQLDHDLKVAKSMVKNDENLATIRDLREQIETLEATLTREREAGRRREEKIAGARR